MSQNLTKLMTLTSQWEQAHGKGIVLIMQYQHLVDERQDILTCFSTELDVEPEFGLLVKRAIPLLINKQSRELSSILDELEAIPKELSKILGWMLSIQIKPIKPSNEPHAISQHECQDWVDTVTAEYQRETYLKNEIVANLVQTTDLNQAVRDYKSTEFIDTQLQVRIQERLSLLQSS